jgi:hypothetical protein
MYRTQLQTREENLAIRDSAALMLPARCSTRTAANHSSALWGFFSRACAAHKTSEGSSGASRALDAHLMCHKVPSKASIFHNTINQAALARLCTPAREHFGPSRWRRHALLAGRASARAGRCSCSA